MESATNQQAEVAAATLGLANLKEPCIVKVLTDSRYVVETMSGRFRKKTNHDWWRQLEKAASKHTVEWEWTKGHAGHVVQEVADTAARKIAEMGYVDAALLEQAAASIGVVEI